MSSNSRRKCQKRRNKLSYDETKHISEYFLYNVTIESDLTKHRQNSWKNLLEINSTILSLYRSRKSLIEKAMDGQDHTDAPMLIKVFLIKVSFSFSIEQLLSAQDVTF